MNTGLKSAETKHLGYLDGLRAVAAIFVVLHHALLQVNFSQQPLTGLTEQLVGIFYHGRYAVDLFIVLSGFCLMLPIVRGDGTLRGGALNFFKRRAWRILPPYYFATALSLLLIWLFINEKTGTHWDISIPVTLKSIVTHLVLMQDAFGDDFTINHAFWSISVEWRIYFLFPLLVLIWRRIGTVATTILAILVSFILAKLCARFIGSSLTAHYIGLFALGMAGATIALTSNDSLRSVKRLPWGWITALLTIVVTVFTVTPIWNGRLAPGTVTDTLVGLWSMSLLITVASDQNSWLSRVLSYKPLVFIGTFAYSIYLIHAPLLQILWQYLFVPFQSRPLLMFAVLAIIGTPIIIGLSYIFFLAFERPFLNKGKKTSRSATKVEAALQPRIVRFYE